MMMMMMTSQRQPHPKKFQRNAYITFSVILPTNQPMNKIDIKTQLLGGSDVSVYIFD